MISWGLYRCHQESDNYNIISTLIQAKLWSFAEWFVWTAPYFAFRYPGDRKRFYASLAKKLSQRGETRRENSDNDSVATRESSVGSTVSMV